MALFTGLSPLTFSVHQLIWDLDSTTKTCLPMCTNRKDRVLGEGATDVVKRT